LGFESAERRKVKHSGNSLEDGGTSNKEILEGRKSSKSQWPLRRKSGCALGGGDSEEGKGEEMNLLNYLTWNSAGVDLFEKIQRESTRRRGGLGTYTKQNALRHGLQLPSQGEGREKEDKTKAQPGPCNPQKEDIGGGGGKKKQDQKKRHKVAGHSFGVTVLNPSTQGQTTHLKRTGKRFSGHGKHLDLQKKK